MNMGTSLLRNRTTPPPPRTATGPYAYAYCRVPGGGVFLWARYPSTLRAGGTATLRFRSNQFARQTMCRVTSLIRNRAPPRTAIGPYAYAYCRVLRSALRAGGTATLRQLQQATNPGRSWEAHFAHHVVEGGTGVPRS